MNNTTEPRLPEIPLYQSTEEEILQGLITLLPLTLFLGLPLLYIIFCSMKWIALGIYKKLSTFCKKKCTFCEKFGCSTELKWTDKKKNCGEYTGNCDCNCNPGRMEADFA